jgi:hypothetical protein
MEEPPKELQNNMRRGAATKGEIPFSADRRDDQRETAKGARSRALEVCSTPVLKATSGAPSIFMTAMN